MHMLLMHTTVAELLLPSESCPTPLVQQMVHSIFRDVLDHMTCAQKRLLGSCIQSQINL